MGDAPYDVVVVGAGPGGYTAAIRAAQLGLKVACVDALCDAQGRPAAGGTCTNTGCIPSKALLQSSEHFALAQSGLAAHGIDIQGARLDVPRMLARKNQVVRQTNDGIAYLFKKNRVDFLHAHARLLAHEHGHWRLAAQVVSDPGETTLHARHVVIATGSSPRALPGLPFDEERVLSNVGALDMRVVPRRLGVIGAGVIGLELGSVWRRLGAEVTVLEAAADFLPMADRTVAGEARKALERQGMQFVLGVQLGEIVTSRLGVSVNYIDARGAAHTLGVDQLIVAIGRQAHTHGLLADGVGLQLEGSGAIRVDAECRTNLPGVWAIGDVVRGPMLAHKAEAEGMAVAERIAGQPHPVCLEHVPSVVYTHPEIAWVGQTEQSLRTQGLAYQSGVFPFMANGRARALGDTTGLVKVLAHAETGALLGVHIVGPQASELIGQAVLALEHGWSAQALAHSCQAHPSLSEAVKGAAMVLQGCSTNL